jgi:OmpA-OmpF porin, OOP family
MAINLLDMLKGAIGNELTGQASKLLGESSSGTQSAIGAILPALLGGMVKQGSSLDGATKLLGLITGSGVNANIMGSLGSLLGGGNSSAITSLGTQLIGSLFGDKAGGLASAIGTVSGLKSSSATSLLSMLAPVVFGFMKNHVGQNNLNASGLMNLLAGQKEHLAGAVDSRIGGALGLGSAFGDVAGATTAVADAGGGMLKKLLPWLLLGGAALVGISMMRGCNQPAEKVVEAPKSPPVAATPAPTPAPAPVATPEPAPVVAAAPGMKSIDLPGGGKLEVTPGGFLESFYNALNNKDYDLSKPLQLDNVNFATGSAKLTDESLKEVEKIAAVMKAYPNVAIRLEGNTDNKGNPASNKALSAARAASVKTATVGMGTEAARMETAGFGAEKPVASNDTDEGRASNRRVDVYLTKK